MPCDFNKFTRDGSGGPAAARASAYWPMVENSADRWDVDPYLVAAVVSTESNWNHQAVSSAGAIGLMQLMPMTGELMASKIGINYSPFDPETNIELGTFLLRVLIERWHNWDVALAAYFAGSGGVKKALETDGQFTAGMRKYANGVLKRYARIQAACGQPLTPAPVAYPEHGGASPSPSGSSASPKIPPKPQTEGIPSLAIGRMDPWAFFFLAWRLYKWAER